MSPRRVVPAVVLLATCISCAPTSVPAAPPPRGVGPPPLPRPSTEKASVSLELIAFTLLSGASAFPALGADRFGGLSGCVSRVRGNELLAVSDDRTTPRFLTLSIELGMRLRIEPTGSTRLETAATRSGAPAMLDTEGVTLVSDSRLIVASEGDGQRRPPGLFEYDMHGRFVASLPIPRKFMPDTKGAQTRGVRQNLAFESLTSLPDGRVYTGTEAALVQDDDVPTVSRGAWSRLLELVPDGRGWRAARELAYPLEPLPPLAASFGDHTSITGLVDLVALSTDHFLAMERSYIGGRGGQGPNANGIRVFEVSTAGAEDISQVESLRRLRTVRAVHKTLVLDLAELAPRLGPRLKNLENFEGLCYGPTMPDGSISVVLVSDDNFSPHQSTVFLLFRIRPH